MLSSVCLSLFHRRDPASRDCQNLPPQQPSCLCPIEQVWKISTLVIMLFIICFTWQSLLLQLTHDDAMQQHCKAEIKQISHIKTFLIELYSGRGFLIFPGLKVDGQTFICTIWCVYSLLCQPPVKCLPSCAGSTISAVDNGLYGVCFKQRNCSDCSRMSLIWNADRNSWAILRPQSWLCDGVDVKCRAGCSQMQQ